MAVATFDRLSYWYPGTVTPALDGVSARLEGGLTVVSGDSGSGKSTFLRVLNGLVPRFHGGRIAGRACVLGLPVPQTPTAVLAARVGFVFQDPELQAVYTTVERDVAFGLENLGVPRRLMIERVGAALAALGLEPLRGHATSSLSGGERQRVALAGALALRPGLLVLDEPTSQLDREGAAAVLAWCRDLAASGTAVVVAEHRLDRLLASAGKHLDVAAGRVREAPLDFALGPRAVARRGVRGEVAWELRHVSGGPGAGNVFEGVDLAGFAGEALVLTGPNGGGKTTLLRLIAGLLRPRSGSVERRPGRTAYLPQNPTSLLHRRSLLEEVELTLRRAQDPEPPGRILETLGLAAVAARYPRDLSSGERQRAAVAAVLAGSPRLGLLDEPTRGIDGRARSGLVDLVDRLRSGGASLVIATHDEELTAAVADRVVRVDAGGALEVSLD